MLSGLGNKVNEFFLNFRKFIPHGEETSCFACYLVCSGGAHDGQRDRVRVHDPVRFYHVSLRPFHRLSARKFLPKGQCFLGEDVAEHGFVLTAVGVVQELMELIFEPCFLEDDGFPIFHQRVNISCHLGRFCYPVFWDAVNPLDQDFCDPERIREITFLRMCFVFALPFHQDRIDGFDLATAGKEEASEKIAAAGRVFQAEERHQLPFPCKRLDASEEDFKILHLVANLLLEQGRAETIDGDRRVIVFVHIHADKQSAKLRILGHT
ncbi:MAG: hypothetical protein UX17_C0017G0007 [Parcubacteria group bacterium GW2011_GWC2_45_7]|nr:MAG: hypothetical protein UX17_C0017G0007 [Parcubacteria group bacterium GW2011_GWC2_45_7]KKU73626.1 MAG: hypothetical protein UX98_C0005G0002 [Parcubacteria group bacterium GW2011_GWA2_47_26]